MKIVISSVDNGFIVSTENGTKVFTDASAVTSEVSALLTPAPVAESEQAAPETDQAAPAQ